MKLWNLATLLTVSILTFSGCVGNTPKPDDKAVVDSTLPVIELTKNGVFVDMHSVGFEWSSISDIRVKGVYVYKKTLDKQDSEFKYYDTVKSRFVTHYVDEDVKPSSEYSYFFKTFSKDFESAPSAERIVNTLPPLESVSWIHAIQNMPRSAKVIWRPHVNQIVKSYIIERRTLSEDKWRKLATVKGRLSAEYIDENLKDNHVYKYRIRVLTYNDITSNPSEEVKVVTKPLPKGVVEIVATKDLPKKIKLNWSMEPSDDFSNFNIYRSKSINDGYDLIKSTTNTEYIDDIDKDGKDYFYRVSVVDKDGLESKHDLISAYGQSLVKPATPSLFEAVMVGNNLEIKWSSSDPRVKSFIVNKSTKKGWFDRTNEEFVGIKGNTFVDRVVEPSTTYYYKVFSVDKFSIKSEPSIEVKFTTTENQGRIIAPKEVKQETIQTVEKPVEVESEEVVQPVDDFDTSEL